MLSKFIHAAEHRRHRGRPGRRPGAVRGHPGVPERRDALSRRQGARPSERLPAPPAGALGARGPDDRRRHQDSPEHAVGQPPAHRLVQQEHVGGPQQQDRQRARRWRPGRRRGGPPSGAARRGGSDRTAPCPRAPGYARRGPGSERARMRRVPGRSSPEWTLFSRLDGHPHRPRRHGRAARLGPRDADAARGRRGRGRGSSARSPPCTTASSSAPTPGEAVDALRADDGALDDDARAMLRLAARARDRAAARARGAGARDHRGLLALRLDLDRGAEGRRLRRLRRAAARPSSRSSAARPRPSAAATSPTTPCSTSSSPAPAWPSWSRSSPTCASG